MRICILTVRSDLLRRHVRLHGSGSRMRRACDDCRAQKKACDRDDITGAPCSLCLAKNNDCIFTLGESSHPTDSARGLGQPYEEEGLNASASASSLESGLAHHRAAEKAHDNASISNIPLTAMRFLYDTVSSPAVDLAVGELRDLQLQADSKIWFEACCQRYFEHLHHRWPIVHSTLFEIDSEPLSLSATIIILGCQLQEVENGVKDVTVQVHEILVRRFCQEIVGIFPRACLSRLVLIVNILARSPVHCERAMGVQDLSSYVSQRCVCTSLWGWSYLCMWNQSI